MTPASTWRELPLYATVSVIALAVDVAILYALAVRMGVNKPIAAAIAYFAGLIVHYVLAVSHVFRYRRHVNRPRLEFSIYALTGMVGLAASYLVVLAGTSAGLALAQAKAIAVVVSFVLTFATRRGMLFR